MASSPAFQFYPGDFVTGTIHMTAEQVGAYMLLLCCQWEQGALPADDASLRRIARCSKSAIKVVKMKFVKCDDGMLRNERLERGRAEYQAFCEKQSRRAKEGWRVRKQDATAMPRHQSGIDPASSRHMPEACRNDALQSSSSSSVKTDNQPTTRTRGEPPGDQPDRSVLLAGFARFLGKPDLAISWGPIIDWLAVVEAENRLNLAAECLQHAIESGQANPQTARAAVRYVQAIFERCVTNECRPGEFRSASDQVTGGASGSSKAQQNLAQLLAQNGEKS